MEELSSLKRFVALPTKRRVKLLNVEFVLVYSEGSRLRENCSLRSQSSSLAYLADLSINYRMILNNYADEAVGLFEAEVNVALIREITVVLLTLTVSCPCDGRCQQDAC